MNRKTLGKRIRTERSNRKLTQEQLAEAAEVSASSKDQSIILDLIGTLLRHSGN